MAYIDVLNHLHLTAFTMYVHSIIIVGNKKERGILQDISNIATVFLCFQEQEFPDIVIVFDSKVLLGKKNIKLIQIQIKM